MRTHTPRENLQASSARAAQAQQGGDNTAPPHTTSDALVATVPKDAHDRRRRSATLATEGGLTPLAGNRQGNETLLNAQGRTADAEWTRAGWIELCEHLHNANGEFRFVMGFRKHGLKQYVRSKRVPVRRAISWAWDTVRGKANRPMAFTPYSMNNRKQSRWGALDFDAHRGGDERAQRYAFAAFKRLRRKQGLVVILEWSGAGWHVWAISPDFHSVGRWFRLLRAVAKSIGAVIRDGECEIFPPGTLREDSAFGRAMRAPGSWNPGTETVNRIWCHNVKDLRRQLTEKRKKLFSMPGTGARDGGCTERHLTNDGVGLYQAWEQKWREKFAITSPGTRNDRLCKLVGEMFHQVGHDMARRIAEEQFRSKTVDTRADRGGHMESFSALWRGLQRTWLDGLTVAERGRFDALDTDNLRDAFRIVRSYRRKATEAGEEDFAVAAQDLGNRLGISLEGA